MMKNNKKNSSKEVHYEAIVSLGETKEGLRTADIVNLDDIETEPFTWCCKVQLMHDGRLYITEKPKRKKNHPIFRDDNCSLSLGHDGNYYFLFLMSEQLIDELPHQLIRQAKAIAKKAQELKHNSKLGNPNF